MTRGGGGDGWMFGCSQARRREGASAARVVSGGLRARQMPVPVYSSPSACLWALPAGDVGRRVFWFRHLNNMQTIFAFRDPIRRLCCLGLDRQVHRDTVKLLLLVLLAIRLDNLAGRGLRGLRAQRPPFAKTSAPGVVVCRCVVSGVPVGQTTAYSTAHTESSTWGPNQPPPLKYAAGWRGLVEGLVPQLQSLEGIVSRTS